VDKLIVAKYPTADNLFAAVFPSGEPKAGFASVKNHGQLARTIANSYAGDFSNFQEVKGADDSVTLVLPAPFPFEIVDNAVQWKPARNLDAYSVLVKMNPNGDHVFRQCLSTKPLPVPAPQPSPQHLLQMLAPPAVAAVLGAGQQILLGVGQTKVCPICQQSLGVGAPSCFRCFYVFQQ
jgi:hypothetical protein